MSKAQWIAALVIASVAPSLQAGVGQGDFEAGLNIAITKTEITISTGAGDVTTKSDSGTVSVAFGYFVLDFLELKGAASSTITDDLTYGVLSPGADFVFLGRRSVAPFVGLAYGLSFGDATGPVESDFVDLHGGLKFFLGERSSLEIKLTRLEPLDSAVSARTELAAGLNFYF